MIVWPTPACFNEPALQTVNALSVVGGRITTGSGLLRLTGNISVPLGANGIIEGQLSLEGGTRTIDILSGATSALEIKAVIADGGGPAGLTKTGPGGGRLSAANTYTGQTTLEAGSIRVGHAQALGSAGTGTLVRGSAYLTLEVDLFDEPLAFENGALGCTGAGTFVVGTPIAVTGTARFVGFGCTVAFTAPIGGGGSLSLDSMAPGFIRLDAVNTYAGPLQVSTDGLVRLNAPGVLPPASSVNLDLGATLDLQGYSQTITALFGDGDMLLGSGTLTIATVSGGAYDYRGAISGTGGLVKRGDAQQILAGTNLYTGPTMLEEGAISMTGRRQRGGTDLRVSTAIARHHRPGTGPGPRRILLWHPCAPAARRRGRARDVLRRGAVLERRTRVRRRDGAVHRVVPGGRRDGRLLRDVHPGRESR